jgi:hypothetical protein
MYYMVVILKWLLPVSHVTYRSDVNSVLSLLAILFSEYCGSASK